MKTILDKTLLRFIQWWALVCVVLLTGGMTRAEVVMVTVLP